MKVKEESEKVGLKLNIQKMKIMASGPITSWEIDGETVETVSDFIFGGSIIYMFVSSQNSVEILIPNVMKWDLWKVLMSYKWSFDEWNYYYKKRPHRNPLCLKP